ncbi:hypothetical protein WN943_023522 [Citrus x changshan-huyou]
MQIPRWQNVLFLKNSLKISTLLSSTTPATTAAAATSIHFVASFHSTPTSCEKWKNKWNAEAIICFKIFSRLTNDLSLEHIQLGHWIFFVCLCSDCQMLTQQGHGLGTLYSWMNVCPRYLSFIFTSLPSGIDALQGGFSSVPGASCKDAKRAQQPSKTYIRYQTRHKRADAKRALKDLLFRSGSSNFSFQNEDPIWKFDGNCEGDIGSDRKGQSKSSARHFGKPDLKRKKRKFRRESFSEDFDDPETIFQERFGNRWYSWTYQKREESSFQYSTSGFEWRKHSNRTDHRTKDWENESDIESDDEQCTVGSSSDRTILGLPPSGPLKLDDVKNAFRLSALKWHPDKHQGSSQAMAEEKFKLCLNAYKSLCAALS